MVDAAKNSAEISDSGAGEKVLIQIRCPNGSNFTVRTGLGSTVGEFRTLLAQNCDIPSNQQRLIYKGRILKDDQTLASYGLQNEHAVHLVRRFVSDAAATAAATRGRGGRNTNPGVSRGVGDDEFGGLRGSLEALVSPGLDDAHGSGASGLLGADFSRLERWQEQLTHAPNMMADLLNMPNFENLMNNPDLLRDTMRDNPLLREVIDENPELAHILNDPSTMQQTLEVARNPELMREMMRNTDRAMSNIESSPEGFNMLRRMYENVQEPLLNATSMAGESGNVTDSNPFAAFLGGQGRGQVQDQSTSTASTGSNTTTGSAAPNSNPLPNPWSQTGANGGAQRNASTRPNPGWAAASPGIGGTQDPFPFLQLLQNPDVSQTVQSMFPSPPQNMNQMLDELADNPEAMQQVLALVQSLSSTPGQQQSPQGLDQTGGGIGTPNNMGLDLLMNMFTGLGSGSPTVPNTSNVPPEELYATQLTQLQEMGFIDTGANIQALRATSGNVHAAVERLLGNFGR